MTVAARAPSRQPAFTLSAVAIYWDCLAASVTATRDTQDARFDANSWGLPTAGRETCDAVVVGT